VKYAQNLSARAVKDLDALDDKTRGRILARIAEVADVPYDPKLSIKQTNQGGLRRSRVGGWRIIFLVDDAAKTLLWRPSSGVAKYIGVSRESYTLE
jgi:mRNA interferase RelE/StbE